MTPDRPVHLARRPARTESGQALSRILVNMRFIVLALGLFMAVAGALWAFESFGWIGDGEQVRGTQSTLAPVLAGLGVALIVVSARKQR